MSCVVVVVDCLMWCIYAPSVRRCCFASEQVVAFHLIFALLVVCWRAAFIFNLQHKKRVLRHSSRVIHTYECDDECDVCVCLCARICLNCTLWHGELQCIKISNKTSILLRDLFADNWMLVGFSQLMRTRSFNDKVRFVNMHAMMRHVRTTDD